MVPRLDEEVVGVEGAEDAPEVEDPRREAPKRAVRAVLVDEARSEDDVTVRAGAGAGVAADADVNSAGEEVRPMIGGGAGLDEATGVAGFLTAGASHVEKKSSSCATGVEPLVGVVESIIPST